MGYKILHGHGQAGPKGKRSYFTVGRTFKTKTAAKKYLRENYRTKESFRYVPTSKIKSTKHRGLVYIS